MAKYGANLPAILNPVGDTCVQVFIPNHPDYIKLFVRAIRMLEVNRMYARDETNEGAKIVTAQWRDRTITPLIEALATSTGSCGVDGECLAYPPFASFISYFPQNPYTEPDLVPPDYLVPPFYVNGKDNEHDLPNYNKGDVLLNFAAINLEPSWNLDNTPLISLCLEGSGVAEIHLLKIVQGGACIISLDNPVDLGDILAGLIGEGIEIIQLNQDITSLPPETAEEVIIEIDVLTEGEHTIYIYFLPTVDDSLIPLFFGGGLREISLCGNLRPCGTPPEPPPPPLEGVTELKPQFQFTADCGLEYRLLDQEDNIVQDWTPVQGWEENAALCFAVGGGMTIDYELWYDAQKRAIYDAANDIAKQIVSGRTTDIAVGSDGTVTDPTTTDPTTELPPDDPATDYDDSAAAQMGGAIMLGRAIQLLLDKIDTYYGPINSTPVTSESDTQFYIKSYFPCDGALMDIAISNYYAYRLNPAPGGTPRILFSANQAFNLYFFCKGSNEQAWGKWLIDQSGYVAAKMSVVQLITTALLPSFWTSYFEDGLNKPSTIYLESSCYPSPIEVINILLLNTDYYSQTAWKNNHRLLFTVENYFTDANGSKQDFWWTDPYNAIPVNHIGATNMQLGTGITKPTINQLPYNSAGKYQFTIDTPSAAGGLQVKIPNAGLVAPFTPNVPGVGIKVTIQDLGEYIP